MTVIFLRQLQLDDANALLEFEKKNQAWFERHIDPRPQDFYSIQGVSTHIQELLASYALGRFHAFVLIDENGTIVGRANLKAIKRDQGFAEVGYRIGQHYVGQGYATQAVAHLIDIARSQWQLKHLSAFVIEENKASARVLEKQGFVRTELIPKLAVVAGTSVDAYQFCLDL